MCQFHTHNTVTFFGGIEGDVQIAVGSTSGTILLDAQGCGVDVPGHLRPNYGTARLSYSTARELRDFLDDELTDPRQPSLSSNATFTKPVIPPARGARARAVAWPA